LHTLANARGIVPGPERSITHRVSPLFESLDHHTSDEVALALSRVCETWTAYNLQYEEPDPPPDNLLSVTVTSWAKIMESARQVGPKVCISGTEGNINVPTSLRLQSELEVCVWGVASGVDYGAGVGDMFNIRFYAFIVHGKL
jgi:hypothetical protein